MFRVFALHTTYPLDTVTETEAERDRAIAVYHKLHPETPVYWHPVEPADSNQPSKGGSG